MKIVLIAAGGYISFKQSNLNSLEKKKKLDKLNLLLCTEYQRLSLDWLLNVCAVWCDGHA